MLVTIGGLYQNIDGYQELLYIYRRNSFSTFLLWNVNRLKNICRNLKKIEKVLDTTVIFVIIIPMFFNVKEVDIYEDDIPT